MSWSHEFTIAVVADVQYADKPSRDIQNSYGVYTRHYRVSLSVFLRVIRAVNNDPSPPSCLLHLGDIIDGSSTVARSLADLKTVLRTFARSHVPVCHVVGNHCLSVPRPVLQALIPDYNPSFYYERRLNESWTLIVLDTCDVSVHGADASRTRQAEEWLAAHPAAPNCRWWNGGVGRTQLLWLRTVLESLSRRRGRGGLPRYALVATHIPLLTSAADPTHVAFNGEEVSSVLDAHPDTVKLVLSGHFHRGGETRSEAGIPHRTVRGIVEDGGLEYCTLKSDGSFKICARRF